MEFMYAQGKTNALFEAAKKVRDVIFVTEDNQDPRVEYDEWDAQAIHFVGFKNNVPICCARLLQKADGCWYVGRVGVLPAYRGGVIGKELMGYVLNFFQTSLQAKTLYLNARIYAVNFYQTLGFTTIGEHFWEIGIEHVKMVQHFV